MPDLGLFDGDRGLARDLAEHERRRLEQVWRDERSRHANRCRSCDAPILWCVTENGKWMPVDATPDPRGNVAIEQRGCAQVAVVVPAGSLREPGRVDPDALHMPHWATCDHPEQWRRT